MITIFGEVMEKIHSLTEKPGRLTIYDARQMLDALQYLAEFLYSKYEKFNEIETEAVQVFKSKWGFEEIDRAWAERDKVLAERDKAFKALERERKSRKETAYKMFLDGEDVAKIKKYADLPEKDLADVLRGLPEDIQSKYNLVNA